jgi:hypothetical protein
MLAMTYGAFFGRGEGIVLKTGRMSLIDRIRDGFRHARGIDSCLLGDPQPRVRDRFLRTGPVWQKKHSGTH